MVVSIDFCGIQRSLTGTKSIEMPIVAHTKVTDAYDYLKRQFPDLPLDEDMLLITVNQEISTMDSALASDDNISFLPHIGGG